MDRVLDGLRIGILGKGGAGKSTVTVLLADALRESGYEVLVIDADSTNHGLAASLGVEPAPEPMLARLGGTVFSGGPVGCPVDDPTPLAGTDVSLAELAPEHAAHNAEGVHLVVVGKMTRDGPGAGCDGPVAKIARDLRVREFRDHGVTLVDFKAGLEDTARGVLTSIDRALVVVDPTATSVRLAIDLCEVVRQIRAGIAPATRHLADPMLVELATRQYREARVSGVNCVLNRVNDRGTAHHLCDALEACGARVLGRLLTDPALTVQWLRGVRLRAGAAQEGARCLVRELEVLEARAALR